MLQLNIHLAHECRYSVGQRVNLLILFHSGSRESGSRVRGGFNVTFGTLIAGFLSSVDFLLPSSSSRKRTSSVLQFRLIFVPFFLCPPIFAVPPLFRRLENATNATIYRLFNDGAIKLALALIPARLPAAFRRRRDAVITSYREAAFRAD